MSGTALMHLTSSADRLADICFYDWGPFYLHNRPEVRQYINYLHDRFVIVPVDKAGNNFGIVCKSFYLDVIKNELGISDDGNIIGNTVYKPIYQKVNDIYTFHEEKLLSTFGMKLLDINHYIPLL